MCHQLVNKISHIIVCRLNEPSAPAWCLNQHQFDLIAEIGGPRLKNTGRTTGKRETKQAQSRLFRGPWNVEKFVAIQSNAPSGALLLI
jgi:hypothetical protein